jgi:hypothetical protein
MWKESQCRFMRRCLSFPCKRIRVPHIRDTHVEGPSVTNARVAESDIRHSTISRPKCVMGRRHLPCPDKFFHDEAQSLMEPPASIICRETCCQAESVMAAFQRWCWPKSPTGSINFCCLSRQCDRLVGSIRRRACESQAKAGQASGRLCDYAGDIRPIDPFRVKRGANAMTDTKIPLPVNFIPC